MKTVQYLSPSSISIFQKSPDEFYKNYLSDNRPPKPYQTPAMSVGSAFDAHAKSWLHERLFGKGNDPKFELMTIFEAQVETQNRDKSWEAGKYCFEKYLASGALNDLLLELTNAIGTPRFEMEIKGAVQGSREGVTKDYGSLILLGKPDIFFINQQGARVIFDWKVNGYYSGYTMSPMAGYVRLREGGSNRGQHKHCHPMMHNGMLINVAAFLEHYNEDWARQLSIYAWLCGQDIGSDYIVAVDQLACKPGVGGRPDIRVAEHRLRVHREFQWRTFHDAEKLWELCHSDHFFRDLSKEESQSRCQLLDGVAAALEGNDPKDKWFREMSRE